MVAPVAGFYVAGRGKGAGDDGNEERGVKV